jgi:glycosyltransferase involved in cell wall biosynthesis
MIMDRVSVVIPCFNYGQYLEEAIKSVLLSTYPNIEVIIVDDGSTEMNTLDKIEILKGNYSEIIFYRQENSGLPAARNAGIRIATGKWILPLDADDLIDPTLIEQCVWILKNKKNVAIAYTLVKLFGDIQDIWYTKQFDPFVLLKENYIPATAMFSKGIWSEVQGYDDTFRLGYEDWEFWLKIISKGYYAHRISEPLFLYRKHAGSMLSSSNKVHLQLVKMIKNRYWESINVTWKNHKVQSNVQGNMWSIYLLSKAAYKYLQLLLPSEQSLKLKRIYYKLNNRKIKRDQLKKENIYKLNSHSHTASYMNVIKTESPDNRLHRVLWILPWLNMGGWRAFIFRC